MPASEFESALFERVEFSAYVAYEQWAQLSGYAAHNPYDVLARILPGLAEALSDAATRLGGWGALEPAGGAAFSSRILINEMTTRIIADRVAAAAPHAPDGPLLTHVLVDAVGQAVSMFVDDPESWRLAQASEERSSIVSLGESSAPPPVAEHQGHPVDDLPLVRMVEVGEVVEIGGVIGAIEAGAQPDRAMNLYEGEYSFARAGSGTYRVNLSGDASGSSFILDLGSSTDLPREVADQLEGYQIAPSVEPIPPSSGPPVDQQDKPNGPDDLPPELLAWIAELVSNATIYRADRPSVALSGADAEAVLPGIIEAFIEWVIARAQLEIPGHDTPAPVASIGSTPVVAMGPTEPTPIPPIDSPPDAAPTGTQLLAAADHLAEVLNLPSLTEPAQADQGDLLVVVTESHGVDTAVAVGQPDLPSQVLPVETIVQHLAGVLPPDPSILGV